MISVTFKDNRAVTKALFLQDTFDLYSVYEAHFVTHSDFLIEGARQTEYTPEETEPYVFWSELRPICFSIIKGKKLPLQFRVIFRLTEKQVEKFLEAHPSDFHVQDVQSIHFTFLYKEGHITLTTGTSFKLFSLDKTLEKAWDHNILVYLDKIGLEYISG